MADLPTFTVTGQPLPPGDPFSFDLLPFFATDNSVSQYREWTPEELGLPSQDAFAPPLPELLPEVLVQPKTPTPSPVPVPVPPGILTTLGAGLIALLFPQPLGPREFDEAPSGAVPPRNPNPPGSTDPLEPPNWDDLSQGGDERLLDPLTPPGLPIPEPSTPVEMPPGEPFFDVSPPRITRPSSPDWFAPFADPFSTVPGIVEVPFGTNPFDLEPRSEPAPERIVRVNPDTRRPFADPSDLFGVDLAPNPRSAPSPDVLGDPFADPIGDGFGDPVFTPLEPVTTSPTPRTPTVPNPFAPPAVDDLPDSLADPTLVEFGPQPQRPEKDVCQCDKKKPKRKKRKPREVCYRGTYVEYANGTSKKRLEQVPCEGKKPKQTDSFGGPTPRKRGKRRTPTWQDTLDDVFGRFQP